ncbi:restriction endonuclease subunit S [Streptomyces sp. NPDC087894]|uniref:restriction endonuclease subunit S n=1 Tax=Streptomyces sp. NPDC087894 TaxID=3365816 RepID=UPI003813CEAE
MRRQPIGSLVGGVSAWDPRRGLEEFFTYIDIAGVDQDQKVISGARLTVAADAPSRARQVVNSGDVLVSTVRPNLNAVAAVPLSLDGATASTGFCVLRPAGGLNSRYLFHWVKSPEFIAEMVRQATGQSYPAVSDRIVKGSLIPLPPLAEQERIATALDQLDTLRAKRREAIALLGDLAQSIFLDMFGNPATNPKGWRLGTVGEILESATYGTSEKASLSGDVPVLRMGNVTSTGEIDMTNLKYLRVEQVSEKCTVRRNDVLFNRTNSAELVGKSAIYRCSESMAYAGYLVRLRVNEDNSPEYLASYLNSAYAKAWFRAKCKSIVGMANINAKEVQAMRLAMPPLELQLQFAECVRGLEAAKRSHRLHLTTLDELFESVQQRAFAGQLWDHEAA